ncbi:MAG: Gfo/Idh/MocA family oxidoreductase [Nitrososphaerota archaeon]
MDKIKIGIIGAGFWGRNHARVFNELKNVEIIAICDIIKEKAIEIAKNYNIQYIFTDYRELLNNKEVDAVSICTPSITHGEIALESIKKRKDLFIEKPMTTKIEEAINLKNELHKNKNEIILMVGFIERFNPVVQKAKELIDKGEIGNIILSYSRRIGAWPERIGDVGVIKDTAIHDIDLARFLFQEEPIAVFARGGSIKHQYYEDYVQATLLYKDRKSALIEANWLTPRKKREMHITGEEGVIRIGFLSQEIAIEKNEYELIPTIKWLEPLKLELAHFIECIKNRKEPLVNIEDGYKATLIAEALIKSIKENNIIKLSQ